jgi:hypothetical protein
VSDLKDLSLTLVEFAELNLRIQKTLLPSFEQENAVTSALNDWVKEVAECFAYEGMVTADQALKDMDKQAALALLCSHCKLGPVTPEKYRPFENHDAFKLLEVSINSEVFCKFLFDLCLTWT